MANELSPDLSQRYEERLVLPLEERAEVEAFLNQYLAPVTYSDRRISRTIYFNNKDHQVPWGYSLRARQYFIARGLHTGGELDPEEVYKVEVKAGNLDGYRSKQEQSLPLSQAVGFLNQLISLPNLSAPLRPFMIDEYERTHYQSSSGTNNQMRMTCDFVPSYFLIDSNGLLVKLADEQSVRIEIKKGATSNSPLVNTIRAGLVELGARRVVSKKLAAYSYEAGHYKDTEGIPAKDVRGYEIESKLLVLDANPFGLFHEIASLMRKGMGKYAIPPTFPHILESASINSYYISTDGNSLTEDEGVKILARPTVAKAVMKTVTEIVDNSEGLDCILRRREDKTPYFPTNKAELLKVLNEVGRSRGTVLRLAGEFERDRIAFWFNNTQTHRVYHLSLDRCLDDRKPLYQMEIEYTGTKGTIVPNPEPAVTQDIAEFTKMLIEQFPGQLEPKPIKKLEWLLSLKD